MYHYYFNTFILTGFYSVAVGLLSTHVVLLKWNLKKEMVTSSGTVINPCGTPLAVSKKGNGN